MNVQQTAILSGFDREPEGDRKWGRKASMKAEVVKGTDASAKKPGLVSPCAAISCSEDLASFAQEVVTH